MVLVYVIMILLIVAYTIFILIFKWGFYYEIIEYVLLVF